MTKRQKNIQREQVFFAFHVSRMRQRQTGEHCHPKKTAKTDSNKKYCSELNTAIAHK
jgi:hypothetical protein